MVILLLAWLLGPLHRALVELNPPEPEPEPVAIPIDDLDEEFGTLAAQESLDAWWDEAYGGVATRGEMQ